MRPMLKKSAVIHFFLPQVSSGTQDPYQNFATQVYSAIIYHHKIQKTVVFCSSQLKNTKAFQNPTQTSYKITGYIIPDTHIRLIIYKDNFPQSSFWVDL